MTAPTMTAPSPQNPRFTPVADRALLVEFAEALSDPAHDAVLALDRALGLKPPEGLEEVVPALVNLLVTFDPLRSDHHRIERALRGLLTQTTPTAGPGSQREVVVCYDSDLAPDLDAVAKLTGLDRETVIAAHLAGDYAVYMYGFAPGYAYLAGLPEALRLPRKPAPLRGIAAGSVLIAGAQCLVSTLIMPTGWWIIGRSPTRILTADPAHPFLFDVGDAVRFRRISRAEFDVATFDQPQSDPGGGHG